jgi:hypothetical protein
VQKMLRILFIGFVFSSVLSEKPSIEYDFLKISDERINSEASVDPIITGITISDEHKRIWKIQNKKYLRCGLCGEEPQAFPGD